MLLRRVCPDTCANTKNGGIQTSDKIFSDGIILYGYVQVQESRNGSQKTFVATTGKREKEMVEWGIATSSSLGF